MGKKNHFLLVSAEELFSQPSIVSERWWRRKSSHGNLFFWVLINPLPFENGRNSTHHGYHIYEFLANVRPIWDWPNKRAMKSHSTGTFLANFCHHVSPWKTTIFLIWRFPENGGSPKSSILMGFSHILNHHFPLIASSDSFLAKDWPHIQHAYYQRLGPWWLETILI